MYCLGLHRVYRDLWLPVDVLQGVLRRLFNLDSKNFTQKSSALSLRKVWYPGASRTRQVVEPQDVISLGKHPSKLPGRLSVGQLITPQSDVYEKDAKLCGDSPPGLRFVIG